MRAGGSDTYRYTSAILLFILLSSLLGKIAVRAALSGNSDYWRSGYSFYHRMATGLIRTGELSFGADDNGQGGYRCFRPPGYPVFMAAVCWLSGDSPTAFYASEAVVSTLTVLLVFWTTSMLASDRAALCAAAVTAFYPYSFIHDTQQQETVLYNALSVLGVALVLHAARRHWNPGWTILAGIATGLAILTRLSHTIPAFGLLLAVVWHRPVDIRRPWTAAALLAVGMAIPVLPWMVRNQQISGRFALSSETGFALARAHNASAFRYFPYRGSIDKSWIDYHTDMSASEREELQTVQHDEFAASAWYRQQGLAYITAHPVETVVNGFAKIAVNFLGVLSPLQSTLKNVTNFLSAWLLLLLALAGWSPLKETLFRTAFAFIVLGHCAVSFVFWAHTSHRSFLDPLFAVLAGIGLNRILLARQGSRRADDALRTAEATPA